MKKQITNYIRAGYSGLYIQSFEEQRVGAELLAIAEEQSFAIYKWSLTEGVVALHDGEASHIPDTEDPIAALRAFDTLDEKSIVVAQDMHLFFAEPNPMLLRKLKDSLLLGRASNRVLVILGCQLKLQPEIEKEMVVVKFELPSREELMSVLFGIAGDKHDSLDEILDAARGMTTTEAENAFALSVIESNEVCPKTVYREKCQAVKRNGLLEIIERTVTADDIGGLELLKETLIGERNLFSKSARDYGLESPPKKLVVGQPGTGKSLTAQAMKSIYNLPLLRLEAGSLFGSLVGQSEENWRKVWATVKAIAPCILWIDEVEGLFGAGTSGSQSTDGGTTQRVIKTILQDLQFDADDVAVIMTANDIDGCPDPLIDRCDVWSVELPTTVERYDIWQIHIAKRGRCPDKYDLAKLTAQSEGYSGRQIEQAWLKAMTAAFNDKEREPTTADALKVLSRMVPTSVTMKEAIELRRKRLENRAQAASLVEQKQVKAGQRRLAA